MLKINIADAITTSLKDRFESSNKDQFVGKSRYDIVDVFKCQSSVNNEWTCRINSLSRDQIELLKPIFETSLTKNVISYVEFKSRSFAI